MRRSFSCGSVALLIAVTLTACSKDDHDLAWTKIDLPADGTPVLRDLADCDGQWWAVGGIQAADGTIRPAAWTGSPWQAVPFVPPATSYYGPRQLIRSVACAGGRVAMVGAWPGGAHGNPRVSTWRRLAHGSMTENQAPFETYGGDTAVNVGPIAAGPAGFAIAGNRSSGAAAWFSPDGAEFTLTESRRPGSFADDVQAQPDGRWLIVGSVGDQPAAWTTDAGAAWTPADPPPPKDYVIAGDQLLVADRPRTTPARPVAVAARGDTLLLATDDHLWQTTVHL